MTAALVLALTLPFAVPVDTLPARAGVEATQRKQSELEFAILGADLAHDSASALLRDLHAVSPPGPQPKLILPGLGCVAGTLVGMLIGSNVSPPSAPSPEPENPNEKALLECCLTGATASAVAATTVISAVSGGLIGCGLGGLANIAEGSERVARYRLQVNALVARYNDLIKQPTPDADSIDATGGGSE